ncbi:MULTISPECIES: DsbA family oxidoreductase [Bacteria]|jgi:predicted DsbA family dithiol-disulfide isomerase|uniref:DsbA family oxidoreductase n=1 Tax=Merismopedia glauca CCAP 1448/3 TaxID=1296344 RepID=A0A2T1C5R1_9CYAN|nr:DsbA family oxidoreductase [Merismopedia glauca]PSB03601.1 DsbA family oxidoreductase [Merismopedia glauca CCAP 1448/3]
MTTQQVITIEIWSDFICPWCWIAKRRLEQALEKFEHKNAVEIIYRAFRLSVNAAPESFTSAVAQKFGSEARANKLMGMVAEQAAVEGLVYDFESMLFGDTLQAHALVKAIIDPKRKEALVELLYEESTSNGKSIFDKDSLRAIAIKAGISTVVIDDAWQNKRLEALVYQDEAASSRYGSSVPLFVFDGRVVVSGAHPAETILESLNSLKISQQLSSQEGAQVCDLNGCD